MLDRGWEQVDFVFVSGDAYVDHPSFGMAIISRMLEAHGFRVGILDQPDWRNDNVWSEFGEPRLGFLVSSGNMDSMVCHYTVAHKRRRYDYYSPGGKMGLRPDHATVVYSNAIRRAYKHIPIILGGIEASLRRLAHYDYWQDSLKRSILLDASADLIAYGMGESTIVAIAEALDAGLAIQDITFIPGTVWKARSTKACYDHVVLPSFEQMQTDKIKYAESFGIQDRNMNPFKGHTLVEEYPHSVYVIQNPPAEPLTTEELDAVYCLPYMRTWHPKYNEVGGIPALSEVKFSLSSNRGCIGECAFCSLNFHQGRIIQSRSKESILKEARIMTEDPDFKGYIHDVGGPTANFRQPACKAQLKRGACTHKRCLSPQPCKQLTVDHSEYLDILRSLRALPQIKKVFVRSGVRFDYALLDADHTFIQELAEHHTSGQLRLAPEHISNDVLQIMGKPPIETYDAFVKEFNQASQAAGKEQYVVPYLMSSHPGSTIQEAVKLAEFCRDLGFNPEQVSDFYPTPSTVSTCIYYTGIDPRTMQKVYCPTSAHEKALQRALIQYRNPRNYKLVKEALLLAGREDLIGDGPACLIRSHPPRSCHSAKAGRSEKHTKKRTDSPSQRHPRKTKNHSSAAKRNRS